MYGFSCTTGSRNGVDGTNGSSSAVRISVEGVTAAGATAALTDPGAQAETVALDLGGAAISNAVLVVQSSASGAFTLANVIQEYRQA